MDTDYVAIEPYLTHMSLIADYPTLIAKMT